MNELNNQNWDKSENENEMDVKIEIRSTPQQSPEKSEMSPVKSKTKTFNSKHSSISEACGIY